MSHTPKPVKRYQPNNAQNTLSTAVIAELERSGKWTQWQAADPRLAPFDSLDAAREAWRHRNEHCYEVVAALAALGSRRGGDDDDAALAVVVLLADGVRRLAYRDLQFICELEDVCTTVWEEVKNAEPHLNRHAARYLLQRARQRLTRPASGMVSRIATTSFDAWLSDLPVDRSVPRGASHDERRQLINAVGEPETEGTCEDLADLLSWATGTGVISVKDVGLLVELIAAENDGLGREEAQRVVGERHGVTTRTIRRRATRATERLNRAVPDYLAAIA